MRPKKSYSDNYFYKVLRLLFSRQFLIIILLLTQLILFYLLLSRFFDYSLTFYTLGSLFSVFTVVYLVSNPINPAYKLSWTVFIMAISPIGSVVYWIFGWQKMPSKKVKKIISLQKNLEQFFPDCHTAFQKLVTTAPLIAPQSYYLSQTAGYPLYQHTQTKYFPFGENFFFALKRELKTAQHFIFLEYFIINEHSTMWQEILNILCQKVEEGVEVKILYDDFGSMFILSSNFAKRMAALGIQAVDFNRFRPFLEVRMNNRDHRKIAVIDNRIAFTGGINIADEYINVIHPHQLFKDTAVMITGEAVWSFTLMFLQLWSFASSQHCHFDDYHLSDFALVANDGFIQPFSDSPHDNENISRNVFLNLINQAQKEIFITTPYLTIDEELNTAFILAARRGVKIKIIMPGVADKWYNQLVSEAFYPSLLEAGVEIFIYKPGFIHSKTILVDKEVSVIGTINFDYRSLYLNFEDGVWMYQTQALKELASDLHRTLDDCRQIFLREITSANLFTKMMRGVFRLIATLM